MLSFVEFLPTQPELLYYGGLLILGVAAIIAIISIIVLRVSKIRLDKKLDIEFGKRRR